MEKMVRNEAKRWSPKTTQLMRTEEGGIRNSMRRLLINYLRSRSQAIADPPLAAAAAMATAATQAQAKGKGSGKHIVMLPFMAQGHLIPFLALARQILSHQTSSTSTFTITIANTPLNIHYLLSAVDKDPSLSHHHRHLHLHLVSLPFTSTDFGLPPNTENTEALPLHQIIDLFHASAALEGPSHQLVADIAATEGRPPICIISDVFFGWASRVAQSARTINVSFTTGGAYGTAAYVSVWQNLPHRGGSSSDDDDDDEFRVPGFPDSCRFQRSHLHRFLRAADGTDPWSLFFQTQISLSLEGSFGWLCNTAEEIEPSGLEILRKYTKLSVWSIGPLLPPAMLQQKKIIKINCQQHQEQASPLPSRNKNETNNNDGNDIGVVHSGRECGVSPQECLEWLDLHPQGSVLYISFGSQNSISASQMMALAQGLEDCGKPFIWSIRPPVGYNNNSPKGSEESRAAAALAKWLPDGFEERIRTGTTQGLLVPGWAPQLDILSHRSTGAFLSHCGWNSVVESLSQGVPIIGWPLAAEQAYNSKMLVEDMGVCVVLTRGVHSSIQRHDVKRLILAVMDNHHMKKKAVEIGVLIKAALTKEEAEVDGGHTRKGSSLRAMDDFFSALLPAAANNS